MSERKLTLDRFTELCKDGLASIHCIKLCNEQETFHKTGVTSSADVKLRDFQRIESLDLKAKGIEISDKDVFFIDN